MSSFRTSPSTHEFDACQRCCRVPSQSLPLKLPGTRASPHTRLPKLHTTSSPVHFCMRGELCDDGEGNLRLCCEIMSVFVISWSPTLVLRWCLCLVLHPGFAMVPFQNSPTWIRTRVCHHTSPESKPQGLDRSSFRFCISVIYCSIIPANRLNLLFRPTENHPSRIDSPIMNSRTSLKSSRADVPPPPTSPITASEEAESIVPDIYR